MKGNGSKQRILIIDDSPLHLMALKQILHPTYEVETAKNGHDGLELAIKQDFSLILLDLIMPGMLGFEVLSILKETDQTRSIPVILITDLESSEAEAKGLAAGAVDYIRKPFVSSVVELRVGIHMKLLEQMRIIESFSLTDGLTGIKNRRCFEQTIRNEWNHAKRASEWLGMLMLDLDKFKNFNDKYGHLYGDTCLKTVASVIQSSILRDSDSVFRWGGEEFAILLPITPPKGVCTVAEVIRKNIAATPIQLGDKTVFVTASIGAGAIIPDPNHNFEESFEVFHAKLDKALYQAKAKGRNRVETIPELSCSKLRSF